MQDAPFFVFRVILITYYKLISSMNIFCTMKNTLVIALQVYSITYKTLHNTIFEKSSGYSKIPFSPIFIPCQFYRLIVVQIEAAASAEAEKEKERKARRGKAGDPEMIVPHFPCLSLLITFLPRRWH